MNHVNVHERANRAAKLTGLLLALSRLPAFPTADEMVSWSKTTWELLAQVAGVNVPSQTTIDALIDVVRKRGSVDFELSPLQGWLGKKPGRAVVGRHAGGRSVVELREHGALYTAGTGATLGEAIAHAVNNATGLEWADETEVA